MIGRNTFDRAEAWVTPEGIFFQGDFYSCRKALKQQWFQRAKETGSWKIAILADLSEGGVNSIYTADSEVTADDLCLPLTEQAASPDDSRDQYQAKIRELRGRLKELTGFVAKK